jgi:hypothetical protein
VPPRLSLSESPAALVGICHAQAKCRRRSLQALPLPDPPMSAAVRPRNARCRSRRRSAAREQGSRSGCGRATTAIGVRLASIPAAGYPPAVGRRGRLRRCLGTVWELAGRPLSDLNSAQRSPLASGDRCRPNPRDGCMAAESSQPEMQQPTRLINQLRVGLRLHALTRTDPSAGPAGRLLRRRRPDVQNRVDEIDVLLDDDAISFELGVERPHLRK